MRHTMLVLPVVALLVICCNLSTLARAAENPPAPLVEQYLTRGELAEGQKALTAHLKEHPDDDQARFGLGVLQFGQAIEHLGQTLHRYGSTGEKTALPFLRLPTGENLKPEPIDYAKFRDIFKTMLDDLARAEQTLAGVKDSEVKLRLHFGKIRLDVNGDGKATDDEMLWKMFAEINRMQIPAAEANKFVICFDQGDVYWLRGYCHLLSAMCEAILAYNTEEAFGLLGPVVFAKVVDTPYTGLQEKWNKVKKGTKDEMLDIGSIADAILLVHKLDFPLQEATRMNRALEHLKQMIPLSRQSFAAIEAETDDDHEWIPNPKQTGVIPNVRVTPEMLIAWKSFLDEAEAILDGKKLVPHWRLKKGWGINLNKVFTTPQHFDVVEWAHGIGMVPFFEEGTVTDRQMWNQLNRAFRGQFFGFAIWFN